MDCLSDCKHAKKSGAHTPRSKVNGDTKLQHYEYNYTL
jgi:hypothetical protein